MTQRFSGKLSRLGISLFMVVVLTILAAGSSFARAQSTPEIRLVLQITIDGLRADLLNRYQTGFGKDGFCYLMKKGVVYTNANYQYANVL